MGLYVLRRLLKKEDSHRLWVDAKANDGGDIRACPLCAKSMSATSLPGDPIVLDLCTRCHVVWFDTGEFEAEPFSLPSVDPVLRMSLEERKQFVAEQFEAEKEMAVDPSCRFPENTREFVSAVLRLPIEYDNPVSRRPFTTWAMGLLVAVVSLLCFLDLQTVSANFGFVPEKAFRMGGITFLTAFFIHGGFFHLAGNLYFLLVFGDNVEERIGGLKFVALLTVATLVGNLSSLLLGNASSNAIPHIGASGGISSLLSFYALEFPEAQIGLFFWWRLWKLPAVFLLLVWILMQVMGAMIQASGLTLVDYGAHLGGAATGFLFWLFWRKKA